jgi:hypothetical protein
MRARVRVPRTSEPDVPPLPVRRMKNTKDYAMTTTGGADVGHDLPTPVLCPECNVTEKQRLIYVGEEIYHLRCQSCGVTCAYSGVPPDGELLEHAALVDRSAATKKRKWTTNPVRGAAVFDPPEPELKQCPGCGRSVHPQNLRFPPEGVDVGCIHCQ